MKALLILAILLFVGLAAARDIHRDVYRKFVEFETKFQKNYATHAERQSRLEIFADNLLLVDEMNQAHDGAVFGVTKFMDLTPREFKYLYLTATPSNEFKNDDQMMDIDVKGPADLPATIDWRNTAGVITPVKNQEQCGSCWAFSATEAIESAWVLANNTQQILGPQQIVDCDHNDGGCGGGNTNTAYEYVIKAGGQETAKDYPYTGQNGACKFHSSEVAAKITSFKYISTSAKQELGTMLTYVGTKGPVSVCVDAAPWQYYNGGVLKSCGDQVDHCVQVVGYDTMSSLDVWLVRNSWGADWGEKGYIYIERGKNLCDIAGDVTVPIV
jgi:C1A family cysteine protease